jgi:hypothetical protein
MQPLSGAAALRNLITSTPHTMVNADQVLCIVAACCQRATTPPTNMKHQNLSFVHVDGFWAARHGKVCVRDVRVAAGYDADLRGSATRSASGGAAAAAN